MGGRAAPNYIRALKPYSKKDAVAACAPQNYAAIHSQADATDMEIVCYCPNEVNSIPKMPIAPTSVKTVQDGEYAGKCKATFRVHSIVVAARSDLFRTQGAKAMKANTNIDLGVCSVEIASDFVQFIYGFYDHLEGHYDILPLLDKWQIKTDVMCALCPILSYGHNSTSAAISSLIAMREHPAGAVSDFVLDEAVTWLVNWTIISSTYGPNSDNTLLLRLPLDVFQGYIANNYTLALNHKAMRMLVSAYAKHHDLENGPCVRLSVAVEDRIRIFSEFHLPLANKSGEMAFDWIGAFFTTEADLKAAVAKYRILKYVCFNDDEEYVKSFKFYYKRDGTIHTVRHVDMIGWVYFQYNDYTASNMMYITHGKTQAQIDMENAPQDGFYD